jgi:hypothetical protein
MSLSLVKHVYNKLFVLYKQNFVAPPTCVCLILLKKVHLLDCRMQGDDNLFDIFFYKFWRLRRTIFLKSEWTLLY